MFKEGNLAIQHDVPPDGNPYNPDRVQVSDSARRTEEEAIDLILYGPAILAPSLAHAMNGQVANPETHLMCSRCNRWKLDKEFTRDKNRTIRRCRSYYCTTCRAALRELYKLTARDTIA